MLSLDWKSKFAPALSGYSPTVHEANDLMGLFENGKIIFADYIEWAQSQTQLPIVNDSFFTTIDPKSLQLIISKFESIKTHWSPLCVPVGEWDGHLVVVGSLFNDLSFDFIDEKNTKVVLLLSNYTQTNKLWKRIAPYVDAKYAHLDDKTTGGFKMNIEPQTGVTNKEEITALFDMHQAEVNLENSDENSKTESEPNETMEGFELPSSNSPETPLGLTTEGETKTKLSFDFTKTTPLQTLPQESLSEVQPIQNLTMNVVSITPEIQSLQKPATNISEAISLQKTTIDKIDEHATAVTAVQSLAHSDLLSEKPKLSAPVTDGKYRWTEIESKWNDIYDEMKTFFDHSLIMQIDEKNEVGFVSHWSPEVKPPAQTDLKFTLKTPSVFRIPYTTKKPYHGYVITNEVNEFFFEEWNSHEVPSHITVQPIFAQSKVIALLIAISNDASSHKHSLGLAEKMAENIAAIVGADTGVKASA